MKENELKKWIDNATYKEKRKIPEWVWVLVMISVVVFFFAIVWEK